MTPERRSFLAGARGLAIHPARTHARLSGVFVIHAHKDSKMPTGILHSDVSSTRNPLDRFCNPYLPLSGGDTLFPACTGVQRSFAALKAFLGRLSAVHASEHIYRGRIRSRRQRCGKVLSQRDHPIIRSIRKRAGLLVRQHGLYHRIEGCRRKRAARFCNFSFQHAERPCIRHVSHGRR